MEWVDDGIVLAARRHGEASIILETMTRDHGRHLGVVRGGRSRAMQPVLQAGNAVRLTWRARLDTHMGNFAVEALDCRAAALLPSRLALFALGHIAGLVRLLPERDPHPTVYEAFTELLDHIAEPRIAPALVARFELAMLDELGFGLDLSRCAASGATDDLVYVSPRSGRAVSRIAGEPWHARLLPLPAFMRGGAATPNAADVADALRLTGYFLERDVFGPRGISFPPGRQMLASAAAG